jgi:hypothetical protein
MFGQPYLEHQAALRLLSAIRDAKSEIDGELLAALLSRQAQLAEKRISGDTDWLGDPGTI